MKIAIATVQVPFIRGGAEALADGLLAALRDRGHQADLVTIPFKWYPPATLLDCMSMGRMVDLTEVNGEKIDLAIALKFPAYYLKHPNKVVWLAHQHRQAYDLWGTEFGDLHNLAEGEFLRETIARNDRLFLGEARALFTISKLVSERLRRYNSLDSTPLYPPPPEQDRLRCEAYEPFVFYPARIDRMKRQRVLVEAARRLRSDMRIVIAGGGDGRELETLRRIASEAGVTGRVRFTGPIPADEKLDYYARCTAVFFGAYGEDLGFVPLEAFQARKPVVALPDTGEAREFVLDGQNGYIVSGPEELAERLDRLAADPGLAERLGTCGFETVRARNISWDFVVAQLTGAARG